MISHRRRRLILSRALLFASGLWLFHFGFAPALRAEPVGDGHGTAAAPDISDHPPPSSAADEQAKRQALSFGFIMLAGIIVGGALLLALIVIWGNRTRRLAQSPLPPVSKRDELWYLKPKKDSQDESDRDLSCGPDPGTN